MRTRDLKPDFWTDEKVVQVSDAAKLLFQGLWNLADREGRLEDKPVSIGFKVRPWDPGLVPVLLDELERIGLIHRYEVDGVKCIDIPTLPVHQRMHPREMASKLPPCPGWPRPGRGRPRQGEPRRAIAPGSAGPSGSSGPAGSSGSSSPTAVAVAVDDGDEYLWRSVCFRRDEDKLPRELSQPRAWKAFVVAAVAEGFTLRQLELAHAVFLRDLDFERAGWPTAVFITPNVWRCRAKDPPRERDALSGVARAWNHG